MSTSLMQRLVLFAGAVAGAALLGAIGSDAFEPYYGALHPVVTTTVIALLAVLATGWLERRSWLPVDRPDSGSRRLLEPAAWATALVVPVIGVDVAGGFPPDVNVLPPEGLVFYPVIALVAETLFRVLPLTILLGALSTLGPDGDRDRRLSVCLVLAALPEPVFQVVLGWSTSPPWASAYVAVHLLAFNLLAVWLYRRHGFLATYGFRLVYYGWWHVAWGVLRLKLLF